MFTPGDHMVQNNMKVILQMPKKCNDDIIPFSIEDNSKQCCYAGLFNFDASNDNWQ